MDFRTFSMRKLTIYFCAIPSELFSAKSFPRLIWMRTCRDRKKAARSDAFSFVRNLDSRDLFRSSQDVVYDDKPRLARGARNHERFNYYGYLTRHNAPVAAARSTRGTCTVNISWRRYTIAAGAAEFALMRSRPGLMKFALQRR